MKFFKTLFLLSISSLAINAWAGDVVTIYSVAKGVELTDLTGLDTNSYYVDEATGKAIYKGPVYADGSEMLPGEKAVVIFAQHNDYTSIGMTAEELFSVDKLGNITYTTEGATALSSFESYTYTLNSDGTLGNKSNLSDDFYYGYTRGLQVNSSTTTTYIGIVYLLRFDSRSYDPETDTLSVGDVVHSWGGSQVTAFILLNQPAMGGNVRDALLDLEFTTDAYTTIKNPTLATTTLDIESLLVTNADGKETTLTGDELTKYLTPAMVATKPIEDGFALSCESSDVLTYTLQTKASLSEEWVNFDTIAETLLADINENLDGDSKKTLANNFEKRYTCLRVKESTQIKIPQSPKETQRFYRLIAE